MSDRVSIKTPKGGTPSYVFVMAVNDVIIGSVTFTTENELKLFQDNYKLLHKHGFGSVQLNIDSRTIIGIEKDD